MTTDEVWNGKYMKILSKLSELSFVFLLDTNVKKICINKGMAARSQFLIVEHWLQLIFSCQSLMSCGQPLFILLWDMLLNLVSSLCTHRKTTSKSDLWMWNFVSVVKAGHKKLYASVISLFVNTKLSLYGNHQYFQRISYFLLTRFSYGLEQDKSQENVPNTEGRATVTGTSFVHFTVVPLLCKLSCVICNNVCWSAVEFSGHWPSRQAEGNPGQAARSHDWPDFYRQAHWHDSRSACTKCPSGSGVPHSPSVRDQLPWAFCLLVLTLMGAFSHTWCNKRVCFLDLLPIP